MLVLTRKLGEQVIIGKDVVVMVLEVRKNGVKLGFAGPAEMPIHREEIHRKCLERPASPSFESADRDAASEDSRELAGCTLRTFMFDRRKENRHAQRPA
jgi:carbon storage regulator